MSNYYDPWMHAVHLFFSRLVQFLLLSLVLGLATWAGLLHLVFEADWRTVASSTWAMWGSTDALWRVILAQAMTIGALVTACLFIWLLGRSRLRRGDRHHRGARVIDAQE
ncbi:hypothetical protein HNQ51_003811 [Inhella inkyongensis]|uniref:Uncharacterized protein n=1 Tax=Inhella inkyongensis TaxID=392593 RepID=A0A840SCI0_9BURK|nr:hypothetical protein [Inhella inkyongensis]MBB5206464.1 hypothetical protein [Inhella inkyongensis]